jgi:nitroreductase
MDALQLLQNRRSVPADQLIEPAPSADDLDAILRAGVAAADHDQLQPWRFLIIRGPARALLGDVFARALLARAPDSDDGAVEKQRAKPLRAPLVLAVAARIDPDNARVPAIEQILSAGAALNQMQLAANALGYGAIWLTGPNAHDGQVTEALGLDFDDRLVGFLYLGTPSTAPPPRERVDPERFVIEWRGAGEYESL